MQGITKHGAANSLPTRKNSYSVHKNLSRLQITFQPPHLEQVKFKDKVNEGERSTRRSQEVLGFKYDHNKAKKMKQPRDDHD